jgi:hypothetical protein
VVYNSNAYDRAFKCLGYAMPIFSERVDNMPDNTNLPSPHNDKEWRRRSSNSSAVNKPENAGAPITRTQQWRILSSTCLIAFTVIGFTQSFGVFQAHYGRRKAVQEGVLGQDDLLQRSWISTIGSLGNGGLVAAFGVLYYPHLPKLGGRIKYVCMVGATLIAAGFATATTGHDVRTNIRRSWTTNLCQLS